MAATQGMADYREPLVSVHMITYNHAPYIAKAIEGVLAQRTAFPFELVIGEDCSTDGTREIVFDYARRYPEIIRVITSERNLGMKKNCSRTTAACRGKYIAWCEGDDYWHRIDKLQIQVNYINNHPECGMVCSDYNVNDTTSYHDIDSYLQSSGKFKKSPSIDDILLGKAGVLTCTVLARRDLICGILESDSYLHEDDYFKMGDTQLWAEVSLVSRIYCFREPLATRNLLPESATRSLDRKKELRFAISNSDMCIYLCLKHELSEEIIKVHERCLMRKKLQLAFFDNNPVLAETVRQKHSKFRPKDLLWYVSVKSELMNHLLKFALKTVRQDKRTRL
jgi:glycosyltransferase involved in cell wall biosynthesis